jgi:hypothetical protein
MMTPPPPPEAEATAIYRGAAAASVTAIYDGTVTIAATHLRVTWRPFNTVAVPGPRAWCATASSVDIDSRGARWRSKTAAVPARRVFRFIAYAETDLQVARRPFNMADVPGQQVWRVCTA